MPRSSEVQCIANKVQYGMTLRCTRPHKHQGRHRWAEDKQFYPLGRLNPDDPIDQAIVRAWNKGSRATDAPPSSEGRA